MEDYYNLNLRKVAEFAKPARPATRGASRALSEAPPSATEVGATSTMCGWHLGGQLGAVYGRNRDKFSRCWYGRLGELRHLPQV